MRRQYQCLIFIYSKLNTNVRSFDSRKIALYCVCVRFLLFTSKKCILHLLAFMLSSFAAFLYLQLQLQILERQQYQLLLSIKCEIGLDFGGKINTCLRLLGPSGAHTNTKQQVVVVVSLSLERAGLSMGNNFNSISFISCAHIWSKKMGES